MLFDFVRQTTFPAALAKELKDRQKGPTHNRGLIDTESEQSARLGILRDIVFTPDLFLCDRYDGDTQVIMVYVPNKLRYIYYNADTLKRMGDDIPGFYNWLSVTDPNHKAR